MLLSFLYDDNHGEMMFVSCPLPAVDCYHYAFSSCDANEEEI